MRYKLNADGYVESVAFGCYLNNCTEYTGEVPLGYNSLEDWATYACVNAYGINSDGNLVLDYERLGNLKIKEAQDAVDNTPLVRKDLYASDAVLDSQYIRGTATGEVVVLEDIKTITPIVKITGIQPYEYTKFYVFTNSRNMMPNDAKTAEISGVKFTKNSDNSISIVGTATEDIEYTVSGGSDEPIFALRKGHDYYLNLGGLECEMRYKQGETSLQQYVGSSGALNVSQSIEVTEVLVKIANGSTVDLTFHPQLEYGNAYTNYEAYKVKSIEIDLTEFIMLLPSNTLYPSDTLYPAYTHEFNTNPIEYVLIENGVVYASINGKKSVVGTGNIGLFSDYNTLYTSKDAEIEITYSTNVYEVPDLKFLQGKATTSDYFKILQDGSIVVNNGYFKGKIEADEGYFKGKLDGAEINGGTISIGDNFLVENTGHVIAKSLEVTGTGSISFDDGYWSMELNSSGIKFINPLNNKSTYIWDNTIQFGGTGYMKCDNNLILTIGSNSMTVYDTAYFSGDAQFNKNVMLGSSISALGFFGNTGSLKQYVGTLFYSDGITTLNEVATKLNTLITTLQNYGLIS